MVEQSAGKKYMGEKSVVKNLWGKIGADGMLAFVLPFSGKSNCSLLDLSSEPPKNDPPKALVLRVRPGFLDEDTWTRDPLEICGNGPEIKHKEYLRCTVMHNIIIYIQYSHNNFL